MKKEYLIKQEGNGKYNIYYYNNGVEESVEFYAYSDFIQQTEIRYGYTKHPDSL